MTAPAFTDAELYPVKGRAREFAGWHTPAQIITDTETNRARYNRIRSRQTRADFIRIHGEEPNAPLSRDRCDALAKGDPAIRSALLRMFGG